MCPGLDFLRILRMLRRSKKSGLTQGPYPLRGLCLFVCLLRRTSSPRIQTKSPTCLRQAGPCARDWIPSILGFNIL